MYVRTYVCMHVCMYIRMYYGTVQSRTQVPKFSEEIQTNKQTSFYTSKHGVTLKYKFLLLLLLRQSDNLKHRLRTRVTDDITNCSSVQAYR